MNTYLYLSTIFLVMVTGMGFFAFSIPHEFVDYKLVAVYLLIGTSLGFLNSLLFIFLRRRTF